VAVAGRAGDGLAVLEPDLLVGGDATLEVRHVSGAVLLDINVRAEVREGLRVLGGALVAIVLEDEAHGVREGGGGRHEDERGGSAGGLLLDGLLLDLDLLGLAGGGSLHDDGGTGGNGEDHFADLVFSGKKRKKRMGQFVRLTNVENM